jgi:leukotriene-A4 hydrolase
LNEGHTVFIERKITGRLHGEAERQFSAILGWKALKESVGLFGNDSPATVLKPDLSSGIDPDDYFSSVPYGKKAGNRKVLVLIYSNRKGLQLAVPY